MIHFKSPFQLSAIALSAMAFVFFAQPVTACEVQEMQFFGIVRNVQQSSAIVGATVCIYQVELVSEPMAPAPSYLCPLVPGEASALSFVDLTCTKRDGDKISGIMVKKGSESWIE
ncbi:hypothetical protein BH10BDE1_BH10BDE1_35430 [soil metagenome]